MKTGEPIFDMPTTGRKLAHHAPPSAPRTKTGMASLKLTLRKLYGGDAKGWVYLQAPRQARGHRRGVRDQLATTARRRR